MGLETGTYPSDFVTTNPTSGDPKAQGDDHLRLIKACTKAALPVAAAVYPLTSGTSQATTSGTSKDFTSIPSWVKRVTFSFSGVSTSGSSSPLLRIGDSGGIESTGYQSSAAVVGNGIATSAESSTTGMLLGTAIGATTVLNGIATLTLVDSATNTWAFSVVAGTGGTSAIQGGGAKSLSATLDRVRLTTVNGTDTFDAGTVNILYE